MSAVRPSTQQYQQAPTTAAQTQQQQQQMAQGPPPQSHQQNTSNQTNLLPEGIVSPNQGGRSNLITTQMSPSAIVDSPDDNQAIKQPNTSQVHSFNTIIQRERGNNRSMVGPLQTTTLNQLINPESAPQVKRQLHKKSPTGLPFKVSPSLLVGGDQSQYAMTNDRPGGTPRSQQQPPIGKNTVGSSIAKKHLHYFKHSAVTSLDASAQVAPQTENRLLGQHHGPPHHHKQSQSMSTHNMPLSAKVHHQQSASTQQLFSQHGSTMTAVAAASGGITRQSAEHLKSATMLTQTENFHSNRSNPSGGLLTQTSSSQQQTQMKAPSSVERQIPIQKVRIAKKIPLTAKNQHESQLQHKSLSLKLANLHSSREKIQAAMEQNQQSRQLQPLKQQSNTETSNTATRRERREQLSGTFQFSNKAGIPAMASGTATTNNGTNEEKQSQQTPMSNHHMQKRFTQPITTSNGGGLQSELSCLLSPQQRNQPKEATGPHQHSFLQKKMSSFSSVSALTNQLSSKHKNQKSTKILRKHVNFDVVQRSSDQTGANEAGSSQPLQSLHRQIQTNILNSESASRMMKKSQSFMQGLPTSKTQTAPPDQSRDTTDNLMASTNDGIRSPLFPKVKKVSPSISNAPTTVQSTTATNMNAATRNMKKKGGAPPPGLEIEIPQSPELNQKCGAEQERDSGDKNTGRRQAELKQAMRQLEFSAETTGVAKSSRNAGSGSMTQVSISQSTAILKVPLQGMLPSQQSTTNQQTTTATTDAQPTSLSSHRPLQRSQNHQSMVLEQIQATQNGAAINQPLTEKTLQVYRPNCQSTRHLPGSSSSMLQGCVPSTSPPTQKQEGGENQQPDEDTGTSQFTAVDRGRPPAPKTAKNQHQSRSQSGLRTAQSTAKSSRTTDIQKHQQQQQSQQPHSPLAQFANYAFQPACKIILPKPLTYEPSKTSVRRNGVVRGYAANTHQGLIRNYNEDRVSIILNISEPDTRRKSPDAGQGENSPWPICSFFGIYDGHGGSSCADFLRDNLHQFVTREPCFPDDPREAIKIGFAKAEKTWTDDHATKVDDDGQLMIVDRSGSCAIVIIIIEEMCYVANVGDSRAVLSGDGGKRVFALSRDHKPCDEHENKRIVDAGGRTYSRQLPSSTKNQLPPDGQTATSDTQAPQQVVQGPLRIFPGRLSVSRSFGDVEAKITQFGGNPQVLIATPEIKAFRIKKDHDFILLGCDGIFDRINNREAVNVVWNATRDLERLYPDTKTVHQLSGLGVDYLVKNSLLRRSLDNVTAVLVAFRNFKHIVFGEDNDVAALRPNNGMNHPNTTKAVPQVSMNGAEGNSQQQQEAARVSDARSNSQGLGKSTTTASKPRLQSGSGNNPTLSKETTLNQRINSCRQLGSGRGLSFGQQQLFRNNSEETDTSNNAGSQGTCEPTPGTATENNGNGKVKLGYRIDSLFKQDSQQQLPNGNDFRKTLTRQDGGASNMVMGACQDENAGAKVSGSQGFLVPIKSTSQRVATSKQFTETPRGQQQTFSKRNGGGGGHAAGAGVSSSSGFLPPQNNTSSAQQQQKPLTNESKIPQQYSSRDGLAQKLNARKTLHKSTSDALGIDRNLQPQQQHKHKNKLAKNAGTTESSDISQTYSCNLSVTPAQSVLATDNKITQLHGQTRKKQTMPRFFKFEENSDRETDATQQQHQQQADQQQPH